MFQKGGIVDKSIRYLERDNVDAETVLKKSIIYINANNRKL